MRFHCIMKYEYRSPLTLKYVTTPPCWIRKIAPPQKKKKKKKNGKLAQKKSYTDVKA